MENTNENYIKDRSEFIEAVKAECKDNGHRIQAKFYTKTSFTFKCERAGTTGRGSKPNHQNKSGKTRNSKKSQGFYCNCPFMIKVKYDKVKGFCALPPTGDHNHGEKIIKPAPELATRHISEIWELVTNAESDEERASMEKDLDDLIAKWKLSSQQQEEEKEEEEEEEEKEEEEGERAVVGSKRVVEIDDTDNAAPGKREKLILPLKRQKRVWSQIDDSDDELVITGTRMKFDASTGIPREAYPFITDVDGDGNCAFRALAVLLHNNEHDYQKVKDKLVTTYHQLELSYLKSISHFEDGSKLNEHLFKVNDIERILFVDFEWFNSEQCGQIVAEAYERPLIIIENSGANVFVPLLTLPDPTSDKQSPLFLVFVNNSHYRALDIRLDSPVWPKFYPFLNFRHKQIMNVDKSNMGTEELTIARYFGGQWKDIFPSCFTP